MFASKKEFVESADRIFISEEDLVFLFTGEVEVPFVSNQSSAFRRTREEDFEVKRENGWREQEWVAFDGDAFSYESDDDYKELDGVADVVAHTI